VNITVAQCNEIVQGSTLREGKIAGCKCARKDKMFCGEKALSPKLRKFEPSNLPSEIKECPTIPYCDKQARKENEDDEQANQEIPKEEEDEKQEDDANEEEAKTLEEVDFGGAEMKEIDGKNMKCCCASNVIGDAKKSTFVACKLTEGTVGCKGLVGSFYHSYNNMGSKYAKLQNFGKCMIPVGDAESSGSE